MSSNEYSDDAPERRHIERRSRVYNPRNPSSPEPPYEQPARSYPPGIHAQAGCASPPPARRAASRFEPNVFPQSGSIRSPPARFGDYSSCPYDQYGLLREDSAEYEEALRRAVPQAASAPSRMHREEDDLAGTSSRRPEAIPQCDFNFESDRWEVDQRENPQIKSQWTGSETRPVANFAKRQQRGPRTDWKHVEVQITVWEELKKVLRAAEAVDMTLDMMKTTKLDIRNMWLLKSYTTSLAEYIENFEFRAEYFNEMLLELDGIHPELFTECSNYISQLEDVIHSRELQAVQVHLPKAVKNSDAQKIRFYQQLAGEAKKDIAAVLNNNRVKTLLIDNGFTL